MATERSKKDLQRNSALRKCFQALVDRKQVNITMDTIKLMLKHELQINLDAFDENLQNVLPFMLIVNIRNWPGWQKSKEYYSGKLNFREWFLKFRQYIILRLSFIIKNGYKEVMDEIHREQPEEKNKSLIERGTQTDHLTPKEEAPFCITIECSPKILSSLVFIDRAGDIILSHHTDNQKVVPSFRQLINWPHVGVFFMSADLSFKRFNRPEVCRFLNLGFNRIKLDKSNFIEDIKIVNPTLPQKSYSLTLLWAYTYQLMELLRQFEKDINSKHLDHIEIVLEEFFKDVYEWELNNSVASNTSVLFNIGHSSFIRSKRAMMEKNTFHRGISPEIIYSETFVPKMETELTYFTDTQTPSTSDISFVFLDTLKKELEAGTVDPKIKVPRLTYSCLFCHITFNNDVDILQHIISEHDSEPNLVCQKCQKPSNMNSLARVRWKHVCGKKN